MYVQVSARLPWNPLCCLSLRCYFIRTVVRQISTQGWRLCLCPFSLLFCLLPTSAKQSKTKCTSSGMLVRKPPPYIYLKADYDSQILASCKILWSSPGRGVGIGAACLLSPAVVVRVPPIALGAISPRSLHSQTGHLVPNTKTSLNWK